MTNTTTIAPSWTLGDRLAKARHFAGMNQTELAEALGIGRASITRYEDDRHTPSRAVMIAWASVTNVPLAWLESGRTLGDDHSTWIDAIPDFLLPQLVAG